MKTVSLVAEELTLLKTQMLTIAVTFFDLLTTVGADNHVCDTTHTHVADVIVHDTADKLLMDHVRCN
jgi:hypothetical protein